MRRLSPSQPVVLDLAEEAIECVVEAVSGHEATLAPVVAADRLDDALDGLLREVQHGGLACGEPAHGARSLAGSAAGAIRRRRRVRRIGVGQRVDGRVGPKSPGRASP